MRFCYTIPTKQKNMESNADLRSQNAQLICDFSVLDAAFFAKNEKLISLPSLASPSHLKSLVTKVSWFN